MSATWLADVLRAAGCAVDETPVPDWKQRGHTDGGFSPVGVLGHHTAGAASGDLPSLGIVRDGRPDLAGPLANLMLSRSGKWVPIAAGRAWHAGAADNPAKWPWVPNGDGNGYLIGIEAESTGTGDWTPAQLAAYPRGVAALLAHLRAGADRFLGHKEWAPSRKPDPHGWPGDMAGFRTTITAPVPQEDDMSYSDWPKADRDRLLQEIRDYAISPMLGAIADSTWLYSINGTNARDRLQGTDAAANAAAAGVRSAADPALIAASVVGQLGAGLAREVVNEMGKQLGGAA